MPEHIYEKEDVIRRLESKMGKTLGEVDDQGIFEQFRQYPKQKGVIGTVVEQCIFGYSPDSKQEADLIIMDKGQAVKTELKTTGMVVEKKPKEHYVAKEPMSITAVGVFDIGEQDFYTSHFWEKLEHMLILYYHYNKQKGASAYEYKDFPLRGYEFHEFKEEDIEVLRNDWEQVRRLCHEVVSQFPDEKTSQWKEDVRGAYIKAHGRLRNVLSYIDLAPKFPPRFRLKRPVVSTMISLHFGDSLEQLPDRYTAVSDIDRKCRELTEKYRSRTIASMMQEFSIPCPEGKVSKGIAEQIVVGMFGGRSKKLNQIEIFAKFGLIAKSVTINAKGKHTEAMKLFRVNFQEITQSTVTDEDGSVRAYDFEDSDLYSYFEDHALLCILFQEPKLEKGEKNKLGDNIFLGFKRLVFSEDFIENSVRLVWEDTRSKILNKTLQDVVTYNSDGSAAVNKSGSIKSAPNFMKADDNVVFVRGGGRDSSEKGKIECVNGIRMLPQYFWMRGDAVVTALRDTPDV